MLPPQSHAREMKHTVTHSRAQAPTAAVAGRWMVCPHSGQLPGYEEQSRAWASAHDAQQDTPVPKDTLKSPRSNSHEPLAPEGVCPLCLNMRLCSGPWAEAPAPLDEGSCFPPSAAPGEADIMPLTGAKAEPRRHRATEITRLVSRIRPQTHLRTVKHKGPTPR